jgi:hypothetical protein
MKRTFKNTCTAVALLVVAFFCYLVIGARFDLASNNNVVESAEQAEDVITIAPMAVEDEFSTEEASEEAEEVVVADEEATESVELAMATFTGKMELSIPVNGIALYRQDPDDTLRTIRWDEVYDQYTVAQYSANGFVKGNQAAQHYLINHYVSRQVAAYGYDVVNASLVPEEARQLVRNDFANFFIGKITRLSDDGKAVTLNCEPYEGEEVHHAVVNILVGEKATEFWTIFVRDDGVWTLCTEKAHHGYFGNNDAPSQPQQPSQPQDDVDPAPVWDDPTDPTPVQPEQPWDPEFNFDVDPAPVWEDPSDPSTEPEHPVQDWDPAFNFEGNTDPAPVWDEPTNVDPAPVWEPVSEPVSDPVPATSSDWDASFNFSDSTPVAANVDPAPVWEAPSAPVSDPVPATSSSWDAGFNFDSSASVSVSVEAAPAAPVVVESAPAPAPAAESNPAPVWDNPVSDSSSAASADDGWDAGFNF